MNLYERSVSLRVALDTASETSVDHELIDRGRQVITLLDTSTRDLANLGTLRKALEFGPLNLETKAISQSARQLGTGLTRYQAKAFQHASTTNFEKAVRDSVSTATRWAKARWRESFGPWVEPIERATIGPLVGDAGRRRQAARIAQKLKALMLCDPLADRGKIVELLDGVDVDGWRAAIKALGGELTSVLQQLQDQHLSLGQEVRHVLERAATDEGFPFEEVSPELLAQLRAAGVLGSLVVRRS